MKKAVIIMMLLSSVTDTFCNSVVTENLQQALQETNVVTNGSSPLASCQYVVQLPQIEGIYTITIEFSDGTSYTIPNPNPTLRFAKSTNVGIVKISINNVEDVPYSVQTRMPYIYVYVQYAPDII